MDRLGIGFIGTGWVVNTYHVKGWQGVRNSDITAVCDIDEENAKKTASLSRELSVGNPEVYTDVPEILQDPNVDAVWLTVPNFAKVPVMEEIVEELDQGRSDLVGITCEKPLGRNVKESSRMVELVEEVDLLHGYLENQVFAPSIVRGKEILWKRGASTTGRPYLARCSEEHGGPHHAWFWDGSKGGGGALNDLACHSSEAARYLLTGPDEEKEELTPKAISGEIASLKWTRSEYVKQLKERTDGKIDYSKRPAEDVGRANITFETGDGEIVMAELSTSWSFTGPGERLYFEFLGPEYYLNIDSLKPEMEVFFSREVKGEAGEDLVEKQAAEQGLMPVVADEAYTYGYVNEHRHMVESFLNEEMPRETWKDGELVTELLMAAYMSAEKKKKLKFPPKGLEDFVPKVVEGTWDPKETMEGLSE